MNYWIIATIVICLFIWYIVKCWSKSFEIVNEGALAQEREAILEIIEQERPLEYAHISNIDYRQKKKHIYHFIKRLTDIAGSLVGIILLSPIFLLFIIFGQKRRWREHFLWTYPCWISWKED